MTALRNAQGPVEIFSALTSWRREGGVDVYLDAFKAGQDARRNARIAKQRLRAACRLLRTNRLPQIDPAQIETRRRVAEYELRRHMEARDLFRGVLRGMWARDGFMDGYQSSNQERKSDG